MTEASAPRPPAPERPLEGRLTTFEQARAHRTFALAILTILYTFNFIDRQILVILQEPIKAEFGLLDSQLGLLTGPAFVLVYVLLGVPFARIADTHDRRTVAAAALGVWSVMTALSGLALSYLHLVVARFGVAVGEAGGSPPAHSMISDLYKREERGRALAIYSSGIYLGILFGFPAGGLLLEAYGWRAAFFAVGVPGVALALVVRFVLKEPMRGLSDGAPPPPAPSFAGVFARLWRTRAFRWIALGAAGSAFLNYGVGNFLPPLFIRVYGAPPGQVGIYLGLIQGIGGALGAVGGGMLADRLGRRDRSWYLIVPLIGVSASLPFLAAGLLAPSLALASGLLFVATALGSCHVGPTLALTHALVPANMRAMASAAYFVFIGVIAQGLGPPISGAASDVFFAHGLGAEALRYGLLLTVAVGAPSVLFYLAGWRALKADGEPPAA